MAVATPSPAPRVLADVIPKSWVQNVLLVGLGAAFVGLAAQIAFVIPALSPVPFTMQTFAVLLTGAALGTARGAAALLLYAAMALIGVPWLASGSSAFSADGVLTPTFGYIVGFILAAALVGKLAERGWTRKPIDTALAMVLGGTVIYAIGVPWLHFTTNLSWSDTIYFGMTVFLITDGLKIAAAAGLFPLVWRQLSKAGLAPREDAATTSDSDIDLTTQADADTALALSTTSEAESPETVAEMSGDKEVVIDLTEVDLSTADEILSIPAEHEDASQVVGSSDPGEESTSKS